MQGRGAAPERPSHCTFTSVSQKTLPHTPKPTQNQPSHNYFFQLSPISAPNQSFPTPHPNPPPALSHLSSTPLLSPQRPSTFLPKPPKNQPSHNVHQLFFQFFPISTPKQSFPTATPAHRTDRLSPHRCAFPIRTQKLKLSFKARGGVAGEGRGA